MYHFPLQRVIVFANLKHKCVVVFKKEPKLEVSSVCLLLIFALDIGTISYLDIFIHIHPSIQIS